jgi:hypothetical protein
MQRPIAMLPMTCLILLATSLPTSVVAAPGDWCAIYTRGSENCSYSSYAQCLATVRGLSATCERNPFPGTNFGRGGGSTTTGERAYRRDRRDRVD